MYYVYSIIRKDIPLADQIVQSAHSAFHAGDLFAGDSIPSLILLQVKDQAELLALAEKLEQKKVYHYKFFEPDDEMGYTSITTGPIKDEDRKAFSNYKLWRP